jgi:hypothetical protein
MALQQVKLHYEGDDEPVLVQTDDVSHMYEMLLTAYYRSPCSVEFDFLLSTKDDCIEVIKIANMIMSGLEND